jgi:hypothetical protein
MLVPLNETKQQESFCEDKDRKGFIRLAADVLVLPIADEVLMLHVQTVS